MAAVMFALLNKETLDVVRAYTRSELCAKLGCQLNTLTTTLCAINEIDNCLLCEMSSDELHIKMTEHTRRTKIADKILSKRRKEEEVEE